jgi:fermentation-respiration switch protein FrsA (DUF1100 family)
VKSVVSQVPLISGWRLALRLIRSDMIAPVREQFDADREARFAGKPPAMIPVVSNDPAAASALPTADSYQWFIETGRTRAPAWRNEVTLRSVEMFTEYEPGVHIDRIAPTPLLMVVAARDHLTVVDHALEAYNRALEPTRLELLPGGHFDAYTGSGFDQASNAACDWFVQHLVRARTLAGTTAR